MRIPFFADPNSQQQIQNPIGFVGAYVGENHYVGISFNQ